MKKFLVIGLLALLALTGCRPKGVLSNRQMEDVLVDLHTAEGVLQTAGYNYGHTSDCNLYYATVLEKHGVTQAEFDSSVIWYTAHPQYYKSVYPKVVARLQKRYDEEHARLSAHADSLQRHHMDSLQIVRMREHIPLIHPALQTVLLPEVPEWQLLRTEREQPFTDRLYDRQRFVRDSLRRAKDAVEAEKIEKMHLSR